MRVALDGLSGVAAAGLPAWVFWCCQEGDRVHRLTPHLVAPDCLDQITYIM
jgi:hypothetical protein